MAAAVQGKFVVDLRLDGYHFSLVANNGQLLYESIGFASEDSVIKGMDTFKKACDENDFFIYQDKFGRFRYVLSKRYTGENYVNRSQCEKVIASVQRFAKNSVIAPYTADPEREAAYAEARASIKSGKDIDWDAVNAEEITPLGKFEVEEEEDGYHFSLIANNGQLMFYSRSYTTEKGCVDGIRTFQRAAYIGNFIVDTDKFGKFRFILRSGSGIVVYVGESYTTKDQAQKSAESVRKFARSARIVFPVHIGGLKD